MKDCAGVDYTQAALRLTPNRVGKMPYNQLAHCLLVRVSAGLAALTVPFGIVTFGLFISGVGSWAQWSDSNPEVIHVTQATYGDNCRRTAALIKQQTESPRLGNATSAASQSCDNSDVYCPVYVDRVRIGNPAIGCDKDFAVSWQCGVDHTIHSTRIPAEAWQKIAWLSCPAE